MVLHNLRYLVYGELGDGEREPQTATEDMQYVAGSCRTWHCISTLGPVVASPHEGPTSATMVGVEGGSMRAAGEAKFWLH